MRKSLNWIVLVWLLATMVPVGSFAEGRLLRKLKTAVQRSRERRRTASQNPVMADLERFLQETSTQAFLVMQDGRILYEKYFNGGAADQQITIFSAGKSVTSVLIGIAQQKGLLKLSDPVSTYLPGWSRATPEQEAQITIEHLLAMDSGLNAAKRFVAPPGTTWMYNTKVFHVLHPLLEKVSGMRMRALANKWLLHPIGAHQQTFLTHTWKMTARSLAAFGQLVLQNGSWNGKQLVPQDFLAASLQTSQPMNPAYGYLWWLNGKESYLPANQKLGPQTGSIIPTAPADLVGALGFGDKKCYVVPSLRLVVVRLGDAGGESKENALSTFDAPLWEKLMRILPAATTTPPSSSSTAADGGM